MTDSQLDEATINVYAALRHLTLAQVASVAHLTVGDVVQHALQLRFTDPGESLADEEPEAPSAPAPKARTGMPLDDFDSMVFGVIERAGDWVGMGGIQAYDGLNGVNVQRTRRAVNRLVQAKRVKRKGRSRAAVYAVA